MHTWLAAVEDPGEAFPLGEWVWLCPQLPGHCPPPRAESWEEHSPHLRMQGGGLGIHPSKEWTPSRGFLRGDASTQRRAGAGILCISQA